MIYNYNIIYSADNISSVVIPVKNNKQLFSDFNSPASVPLEIFRQAQVVSRGRGCRTQRRRAFDRHVIIVVYLV